MSHLSRRAATSALRFTLPSTPIRALASTADTTHTTSSVLKPAKQPAGPYPVPKATFPVYKDPWATPTAEKPAPPPKKYSERTVRLVQGLARIMGYNSRTSTAIRETSRMMRGIVEAVERDSAFWYDGELSQWQIECKLTIMRRVWTTADISDILPDTSALRFDPHTSIKSSTSGSSPSYASRADTRTRSANSA